jgi:hypothetical protein
MELERYIDWSFIGAAVSVFASVTLSLLKQIAGNIPKVLIKV